MKNLIICFAVIMTSVSVSNAQTDTCSAHLKDANTSFDQGSFDEAKNLLISTLNHCSLSKEEKIHANKLLISCYLAIDDIESADKTAEKIMQIDPNYMPDKFKDDPKLVGIFNKFKPVPSFTIGFGGGVNMPMEHTVNTYSVVFPDNAAPASYKNKVGFQLQLQAEDRVYKNFWVQLGVQYRVTSYEHDLFNVDSNTINYKEKLSYLDIPISAKYYYGKAKLRPYVFAGVDLSILANALSTTTRADQKDIINRTALRNSFGTGYLGGIGASYRMKSFMFFAEVRYTYFPEDVNKAGTRYDDPVNLFKYYYIDDDFTLNNLQFNVGASFILSYKNSKVN